MSKFDFDGVDDIPLQPLQNSSPNNTEQQICSFAAIDSKLDSVKVLAIPRECVLQFEGFVEDFNNSLQAADAVLAHCQSVTDGLPMYARRAFQIPRFSEPEAREMFFDHINTFLREKYSVNLKISRSDFGDYLNEIPTPRFIDTTRLLAYVEKKLDGKSLSDLSAMQELKNLRNAFMDNVYRPNIFVEYNPEKGYIKHSGKFSNISDRTGEIWLLSARGQELHPLKDFFYNIGRVVEYFRNVHGVIPGSEWDKEFEKFIFSVRENVIPIPKENDSHDLGYPDIVKGRATTNYLFKKHSLRSSNLFDSIHLYKNGNVVYTFTTSERARLFYETFVKLTPEDVRR